MVLGPNGPQEKPAGSDQDPVGQGQPLPLATLGLRNPSAISSPRDQPHGGPGEPSGNFWSSGLHEERCYWQAKELRISGTLDSTFLPRGDTDGVSPNQGAGLGDQRLLHAA